CVRSSHCGFCAAVMWSRLCRSLMRASTAAIPAGSDAVDAIACCEDVCARTSPEDANRGLARTIAPSRVAAALAARTVGWVKPIMIHTPCQLRSCDLLKRRDFLRY